MNEDHHRVCRKCGKATNFFPRSHILPAFLGRHLQGDSDALLGVPTIKSIRPTRIVGHGHWERMICLPCEDSFGAADGYFARFFDARTTGIRKGNEIGWYRFDGADPVMLQRFFLTCLFRAHLTTLPFYGRIDLGPFADPLCNALDAPAAYLQAFPVFLIRRMGLSGRMMGINPTRAEGVRYYEVHLPGFTGWIKMDRRAGLPHFNAISLGPGRPVEAIEMTELSVGMQRGMAESIALHGDVLNRIAASIRRAPKD